MNNFAHVEGLPIEISLCLRFHLSTHYYPQAAKVSN